MPLALDPREPSVALPGKWTFWAETMTGYPPTRLGMVDVSAFYCLKRVSNFGYGNFTVNLPCGLDTDTMLTLWGWRLWAFYDTEPYFCGVPTGVVDTDGSEHVQFTMIELPGYLNRRQWDYYPDRRFQNWEQTAIAREIAQPVEDVGVQIWTEAGSPAVTRDRTYEYLEGGSRGQLLVNLSGVLNGPEWRTEYRMTANARPECYLRIAYPRVGSDSAGLGVAVPGAIINYRYQMDSDQLRTRTFAVGDLPHDAAEGTPRPVVVAMLDNPRLPRLDAVDDWPGTILTFDTSRARHNRRDDQLDRGAASDRKPARVIPVDHELQRGRHGNRAGRDAAHTGRNHVRRPARPDRDKRRDRARYVVGRFYLAAAGNPRDGRGRIYPARHGDRRAVSRRRAKATMRK